MRTKIELIQLLDNRSGAWDYLAPNVANKPWIVDYYSNRSRNGFVTRGFSSRDAAREFRRNLRNKETN